MLGRFLSGEKKTTIFCADALICKKYFQKKKHSVHDHHTSVVNFFLVLLLIVNHDADDSATTRYKIKSNAATRIKSPFSQPHTPQQK